MKQKSTIPKQVLLRAIERLLEIIGEAASNVSSQKVGEASPTSTGTGTSLVGMPASMR